MKNYLLVLLAAFSIGFLINASAEVESDLSLEIAPYAEISNIDVLLPELTEVSEIPTTEIATYSDIARVKAPTAGKATPEATLASASKPPINYTISKNDDTVVKTPGNYIRRVRNLVYGHNSNNLLGTIRNLSIGSVFTLTEKDGTVSTYQVANIQIFKKVDDTTLELCSLSDYENCTDTSYYMDTLQNANFQGKSYSVAMMTCDGKSLGGGDATHRRVVFAYRV